MIMGRRILLALAILALSSPSLAADAGEGGAGSPFRFSIAAGAEAGLENILRGASVRIEAGLVSGKQGERIGGALELGVDYDASLGGGFLALACLCLVLGEDLRIKVGSELPFAGLVLSEPISGGKIGLSPAALLCRFSLESVLFQLVPAGSGKARVTIAGELSWSCYEADEGRLPEAVAKSLAGILGFEAGFRAGILLRIGGKEP